MRYQRKQLLQIDNLAASQSSQYIETSQQICAVIYWSHYVQEKKSVIWDTLTLSIALLATHAREIGL